MKELLLAFPQSYYVENGSLGLYLISHGLEDNISFDIAVVLQQLYAEKKIADIQAYLKSIHLLFAGVKEIDFGLEQKMDLPYFTSHPAVQRKRGYGKYYLSGRGLRSRCFQGFQKPEVSLVWGQPKCLDLGDQTVDIQVINVGTKKQTVVCRKNESVR